MNALGVVLWIFASYLLGSLPFGFLIGKWMGGKNVLENGWRKTSASNVARTIGLKPAIFTAILDLAKGYLAVWVGQALGLSLFFQGLAGIMAVAGHNWSCFLRFQGGRGIAPLFGGLLAFSSKIFMLGLAPFLLLALFWNSAVGTVLLLAVLVLAGCLSGIQAAPWLTVLTAIIVLVKRWCPLRDIIRAKEKLPLLTNRFLFDNDQAILTFRIARPFHRRINGNGSGRYGLKEKMVLEISHRALKNLIIAATQKIVQDQEEINRINVFPVADKDTGYNLAATLLGIAGAIGKNDYASLSGLADDIKQSTIKNARGNAGMILAGWLLGFTETIQGLSTIDSHALARAMQRGAKSAFLSIDKPTDGTILDSMTAAALSAADTSENHILNVLQEALKASRRALFQTKNKLAILKKNNVVDAGALGFVKILEAWSECLENPGQVYETDDYGLRPRQQAVGNLGFFETSCRFRNNSAINLEILRQEFLLLGDCLDIIATEQEIKLHIHTSFPEKIKEKVQGFEILEWQAESQALSLARPETIGAGKKPVGLVVCDSSDLAEGLLREDDIEQVSFVVKFPPTTSGLASLTPNGQGQSRSGGGFPDGSDLPRKDFFGTLKKAMAGGKPLPTTAAPSFGDFITAFQRALARFEKVLCITPSAKLSGAYSSAKIARSMLSDKHRITVFDCDNFEAGEGLTAMKALELIGLGQGIEQVVEGLKVFCSGLKLLACVPDLRYCLRSGRVKVPPLLLKPLAILHQLGVQFLLVLEHGHVKLAGVRFSKNIAKILARETAKELKEQTAALAIVHADCPDKARALQALLKAKTSSPILFISPISPVIGLYAGPGSLIVGLSPNN